MTPLQRVLARGSHDRRPRPEQPADPRRGIVIHPIPDRGVRGLEVMACRGSLDDGDDVRDLIERYSADIVRAAQRWTPP